MEEVVLLDALLVVLEELLPLELVVFFAMLFSSFRDGYGSIMCRDFENIQSGLGGVFCECK